jgi:ATP-dependent protease ClpP protease subunit
MLLYSDIGGDRINGHVFAQEMQWLEDQGVKKIKVRINSQGGSVLDGYSIYSAIVNSSAKVHTYIDGIAASIAGVIAMSGNKVYMADHGLLMVHNPTGSQNKELLDLVKNSLITIFKNKTQRDPEELSNMMNIETWMDSSTALEKGFVDEIVVTNKKVKVDTNQPINKIFAVYNSILNKKYQKMDKVTSILDLKNEASEDAIVEKVTELKNSNKSLSEENQALKTQLEAFKAKEEQSKKDRAVELVENAISEGKLSKEAKDSFVELAISNYDAVKNSISGIKVHVDIIKQIENKGGSDDRSKWTYDDWAKNDSEGLKNLRNNNPAKFNELVEKF